MCSRFASVENGASPRWSRGIGIWCRSAYSTRRVREVRSHSRHGAITLMSGFKRVIGELEPHLVVALAGGAVGDRVGADRVGDLDLALGDQRPRDRGAEEIFALVERIGAEHREDEIAHEFLAQIVDEDLLDAHRLGLAPRRLQLLALADIGGEGDDLAAIGLLQPAQDDRGVEPARIGQHNPFHFVRHRACPGRGKGASNRAAAGLAWRPSSLKAGPWT